MKLPLDIPYSENQKLLLQIIRKQPGLTRAELASKTNFSMRTITMHIAKLILHGVILEGDSLESTGGRKASKIIINPNFSYVLSVDIGTYSVKIGIVRLDGSVLHREIIFTEKLTIPSKIIDLEQLKIKLQELLDQYGKERFLGLGIGISGLVDYESQEVIFCPNIDGWNGVNVEDEFEAQLGIPVLIDTSARCMALAEHHLGIGSGIKNQVFVSVGFGIGAGIIVDSNIFRGANGAAGELGHVFVQDSDFRCSCGKFGCLENFATLPMIKCRIQDALEAFRGFSPLKTAMEDMQDIPVELIAKASEDGDKIVNNILIDTGKLIGISLANLINILNPELIVLSGSVIEYFPLILDEIKRTVKKHSLITTYRDLSIVRSSLGNDCPLIGCAMQLINRYFEN